MSKNLNDHYAYGPSHRDLETVMRLQAVKRWHMIETTRTQTLAEHSANVAALAMIIAHSAPQMFFGPSARMAVLGLVHDAEEAFTGDVPTHTKRWLTGLSELGQAVVPSAFKDGIITKDQKILLKICDLADGIRFIRLHGVDHTARHAREGLEQQMVHWFLEAELSWPDYVLYHVRQRTTFYAYENESGNTTSARPSGPHARVVDADVARGPGNISGGAGPTLRNEGAGARDGMVGAEGDKGQLCRGGGSPDRADQCDRSCIQAGTQPTPVDIPAPWKDPDPLLAGSRQSVVSVGRNTPQEVSDHYNN